MEIFAPGLLHSSSFLSNLTICPWISLSVSFSKLLPQEMKIVARLFSSLHLCHGQLCPTQKAALATLHPELSPLSELLRILTSTEENL